MLILIYMIIGGISGILCLAITRRFTNNNAYISLSLVISIATSIALAALYIAPIYLAETYSFYLKKTDLTYQLIADKYPEDYHQFIELAKSHILSGKSNDTLSSDNRLFINKIFIKSIPTASNPLIFKSYQIKYQLDIAYFRVDPALSLYFDFPYKFTKKPSPGLMLMIGNDLLTKNLVTAQEATIRSAIQTPQPNITLQEGKTALDALNKIYGGLIKQFGTELLNNLSSKPDDPQINQRAAAYAQIVFNHKILQTGPETTGNIYKYLATQRK